MEQNNLQNDDQEPIVSAETIDITPVTVAQKSSKKFIIPLVIIVILIALGIAFIVVRSPASAPSTSSTISVKSTQTTTSASTALPAKVDGLQLDTSKNYGNKYTNGILPVGDGKLVTTGAKKGYIYACRATAGGGGGASTRGPWFSADNTTWDMNKKSSVNGSVTWKPNITIVVKDGKRVITTNSLPNHVTGIFPIMRSDPAYRYDANPNTISAQSLTYTLSADPAYGEPKCMNMETGVMITGSALLNGFDAEGRDAAAWEIQDACDGHPQEKGEYHYHSLSRCITDQSVDKVIGYALDGFPITGPKVGINNILTTQDLDECHGIVSEVIIDNVKKMTYHYVMTQDFPYSASCFRAAAIQPPGAQVRR